MNRKSDGNVPEKPMHIIPNAVFYCKNGYRGIVQNSAPKARQLPALCLRKEETWITEWLVAVAIRISIGIGGC